MSDRYAIITNYIAPTGRIITHAYGPYSVSTARRARSRILKVTEIPDGGSFRVNVCKLLVVDDNTAVTP